MTKKHFKKFAEAIATIENKLDRLKVKNLVGSVCSDINPNFDWIRWNLACNGEPYRK